MEQNREYDPIGCDHLLPNGLSAWMFQSESSGSGPDTNHCVAYHVCYNCGEIRIAGYRWDGKSNHTDRFNEIIHVCHPDAIDAIIKQANFFNEDAKWSRADDYAALQAKCDRYEAALKIVEKWELPATGKFWDKEETKPMSYGAAYGSNGERKYMRNVAREALSAGEGEKESTPLPFEDIKFMESCNLYPHVNNSIKILTENDEGAWLEKDDLIRLAGILYKYATQKEDKHE